MEKNISRSSIFRSMMKEKASKRKEEKYADVPLRTMMPRRYNAAKRTELKKVEQNILEDSER